MKVRLGYVAIALNLPNVTTSSTLTFTRYKKLLEEEKINKLKEVTLSNIIDLKKILNYNIENNIHFYRITSRLVPLASHPEVFKWNYKKIFKIEFEEVGKIIDKSNMRVDTHPDQFNVINSINEKVVKSTIKELMYHVNIFEAMNYNKGKMVIHIGSSQGGKEKSIQRFIDNFNTFPKIITSKLILENDDKVFNSKEVLELCNKLKIPMVLDYHHHICNPGVVELNDILGDILNTWEKEFFPPKLHISSPKDSQYDRKHSDYINPADFINLIELLKVHNKDVDIMIEAKQKDKALYKLAKDIKLIKPEWKWEDSSTIIIND